MIILKVALLIFKLSPFGVWSLETPSLKGLCHAILYIVRTEKVFSDHLNYKNNGLDLLLKTIVRH